MVSHPKHTVSPRVLFCLPRSGLLLYVPPYLFIVEHIYFNMFVVYTGCWQRGGCSVLCCGQELHISIMQIVIITLSVCVCVCVCADWLRALHWGCRCVSRHLECIFTPNSGSIQWEIHRL